MISYFLYSIVWNKEGGSMWDKEVLAIWVLWDFTCQISLKKTKKTLYEIGYDGIGSITCFSDKWMALTKRCSDNRRRISIDVLIFLTSR